MKGIVVYESHWGNTAAVARAVAEGMGAGTLALSTDEATGANLDGVELIVAGAPVIAFSLSRESSRKQIAGDTKAPTPPDVSHPLLREWLDILPAGRGWGAAFETRIWWSPRGATGTIESKLRKAGYAKLAQGRAIPGRRLLRTPQGGRGWSGPRPGVRRSWLRRRPRADRHRPMPVPTRRL